MIDASIPLKGLLINRNDELQKQQQMEMGNFRMQQARQEQAQQSRLADLLPKAAAGDQQAMNQVAAIDTGLWSRLNSQQSEALKQNRERVLLGAKIVREINPQDEGSWQVARQAAQRAGVDISDVPANFDPNYVRSLISVADAMEKDAAPTSMQRNYEFLKGQNPQLADRYLQGQAEGDPIVQRNEDGTMTVYPRSMINGGGQPAPPPPPPGFVVDGQGGQPGQSSAGGFPGR